MLAFGLSRKKCHDLEQKHVTSAILVGDFNPFEQYARQNGANFPNFRGENKPSLKPPPRVYLPTDVP